MLFLSKWQAEPYTNHSFSRKECLLVCTIFDVHYLKFLRFLPHFSLFFLSNSHKCRKISWLTHLILSLYYSFRKLSFYRIIFYHVRVSKMKASICGVRRMAGTGKTSGNAYDMCNIMLLVPVEQVNNPKMQINGAGFSVMEMPLALEALPQFMNIKYPMSVELITDVALRAGKPQTIVTGIQAKAA